MADQIQGSGGTPISPQDLAAYKSEYKQAANLFDRALADNAKSDNKYQKHEFQEVMDQCMQVLNETAGALKQEKLTQKIQSDLAAYQKHETPNKEKKLHNDLEQAKNV